MTHLRGARTQEDEFVQWMGHIGMRGTPRLGASVLRGMMVDERMGSFG
jgi:hypothetical protein